MFSIGTLGRRSGVNIETIRYYEREGVLPAAQRAPNGRRVYGHGDVQRLAFIRHARELGFELSSVRSLLAMQEQPSASCDEISTMAQAKLSEVEIRLRRLLALRAELRRLSRNCRGGTVAACRIIEAIGVLSL